MVKSRRNSLSVETSPSGEAPFSAPLDVRERWLMVLAGANLLAMPWLFGGMSRLSQAIALALSLGAFGVALCRRSSQDAFAPGRRLLAFPLFWIGLVYFAIVAVQILNPAWQFRTTPAGWFLRRIPHVEWLPHGIEGAPFKMFNVWRVLLIHTSVWLLLCALWVGITRRKSARWLLTLIAIDGAVVAAVFLVQRLTGATQLLWSWTVPADEFVAGFVYRNHAGAYLNLGLATCLGVGAWYAARARRRSEKSHPGVLFGFLAVLIVTAQFFSYGRAATFLGAAIVAVGAAGWGVAHLIRRRRASSLSTVFALVLLGVGFVAVSLVSLDVASVWRRFEVLFQEEPTTSVTFRQISARATVEMARDEMGFGHGVASFRFVFPKYQQRYPEIFQHGGARHKLGTTQRYYWEHAHNDYAELWAEQGIVGIAMVGGLAILVVVGFWRAKGFARPALLLILAGPAAVLVHAAVDFPFHNPAVLMTFTSIILLTLRWAKLEMPRTERPKS